MKIYKSTYYFLIRIFKWILRADIFTFKYVNNMSLYINCMVNYVKYMHTIYYTLHLQSTFIKY